MKPSPKMFHRNGWIIPFIFLCLMSAEAGEGGAGGLSIQPPLIIAQVVSFLIFFGLLYQFLFKSVLHSLAERTQKIKGDMEKASVHLSEMEKLKVRYEEKLEKIDEERRELIRQAVKRGEEIREELLKKTEMDIQKMKEKAERDIRLEMDSARKALQEDLVNTAVLLASRLMQEELNEPRQQRLVQSFLKKLDEESLKM